MCGRFTYQFQWRQLVELLGLVSWPEVDLTSQYNLAPTQEAPVVRLAAGGGREGAMLRWGLIPAWADDPAMAGRHINARAETISERPAYRDAFAARRCLVPISGFYEWRTRPGGTKQPYWIGREDREPFWLAGIWEQAAVRGVAWQGFSILTTSPNELMRPVHDRMPVLVSTADIPVWLAPGRLDEPTRQRLLAPSAMPGFEVYPVGAMVGNPKAQGPELMARVAEKDEPQGFLF